MDSRNRRRTWRRGFRPGALILFFGALLFPVLSATPLFAQKRTVPALSYYLGFRPFHAGEYQDALKFFQKEARSAIKTPQSRWIDSICYETMIGECYYQMGVLDQALEHYTAALQLYLAFPDWMVRVQFMPIRPAGIGARKQVPWGVPTRTSKVGDFDRTMLMTLGENITRERLLQGGPLQTLVSISVAPQEIIRCTALAIRRRTELLGPLSKHDAMTGKLLSTLLGAVGPSNHWSEAWVDLERGLAYVAAGRADQGVPYLQRSLLAGGEYDHPLTSYGLLELGRLSFVGGDYAAALTYFQEATYTAVNYENWDVLEEAFRLASIAHLAGNRPGVYPSLAPALAWINKDFRVCRASLLISASENFAVAGQNSRAAALLDDAHTVMGRTDMGKSRIGARLHAIRAMVLFQQRKIAEGRTALSAGLAYMRRGSHWLFHIALADQYYLRDGGRATTSRVAADLFAEVLRDPLPGDWALDPLECLSALTVPHPPAFDHWFETLVRRKDYDQALEAADYARRHRFFTSLGLGGRLESLRWILEAPEEMLDPPSLIFRQDLRARYPGYAKLSDQARKLREKLAAGPLPPQNPAAEKALTAGLNELAALSAEQEAMLPEMAVRREAAPLVFPPVRKTAEIKKGLREGQAALVFFAAPPRLYAMVLDREQYSFWEVAPLPAIGRQMQSWLRDLGLFQANNKLTLRDLADAKWKTSGAKLLEQLLKGSRIVDFCDSSLKELVIVPDGMMWYLPFDALQVVVDGRPQSLLSRFRIRYAPTFALATPVYPTLHKPQPKTAVVLGKLAPQEDDALVQTAFAALQRSVPGAMALRSPPPAPASVYGVLFERMIVLDDLSPEEKDPYGWFVSPQDRGRPGGTLADWLHLPWGGPEEILLPGFHTAAEDGLRRRGRGLPGNEVFLTVCGLMSDGARTILLGRWRTGGQSSYDLVREFAQELPHAAPADAWQRAVLLESETQLNLEAEPRLKTAATDEIPKGDHPFFWGGYLLIDSGRPPEPALEKPAAPPIMHKLPAAKGT
ncbi:MAG: hypothetical protein JXB10_05745 [Pirellulales bacterium]|nr:hypothetical protein [Pirellulales bacterium]